jgi:hypothetical protein
MHFVINVSSFGVISVNIVVSFAVTLEIIINVARTTEARLDVPYNLGTWVNRGSVFKNFINTEKLCLRY